MTELAVHPETAALVPGNGEVAQRCRTIDWASTSLGPVELWPAALRTAVRTALECPFPINLWCGRDMLRGLDVHADAATGRRRLPALTNAVCHSERRCGSTISIDFPATIGPTTRVASEAATALSLPDVLARASVVPPYLARRRRSKATP